MYIFLFIYNFFFVFFFCILYWIYVNNVLQNKDYYYVLQIVELLNQANLLTSDKEKINLLAKVQELVIHRKPELLDSFYDEIVAFISDRSADVRKWTVCFIEEAWLVDMNDMIIY